MAEAHRAYLAGALDSFYAPLVVDDERLARGLEAGTYAIDDRLRDRMRALGFGHVGETPEASFRRRGTGDAAAFAAEYSALQEADLGLALGARVDAFERRLETLERSPLARIRSALPGKSP
jgi:hypothetical protein